MFRKFSLLLLVSVFLLPTVSQSGVAAGGASEWTQILNNVQLLKIAIADAMNVNTNIQKKILMLQNLKRLPATIKRDVKADLERLAKTVTLGRALSYGSGRADSAYREAYGGYDARLVSPSSIPAGTLEEEYRAWSQTNHDTVRSALRAANMNADQFYDEDAAVRAIDRQMSTATGQLQALQAGGRIAQLQIEQMQKLRQLVQTQVRLQSADLASDTADRDKQAAEDARVRKSVDEYVPVPTPPLKYKDIWH